MVVCKLAYHSRFKYLASLLKSFRTGEELQCTCHDFLWECDNWNAVYEYNSRGKIPYVPIIQAPYFQWIGKRRDYTSKLQSTYPKCLNLQILNLYTLDKLYVSSSYMLSWPLQTEKNLARFPARASDEFEAKRPPAFPPTFLYSLSWEDPREDDKVLDINKDDTVLTLTSGGCNALDLIYQVIQVVCFLTA